MEYQVRVGSQVLTVRAGALDQEGWLEVSLGGEPRRVKVEVVSPHQLHLTLDGRAINVFLAPSPEGTWVWAEGRARLVEEAARAGRRARRAPGAAPDQVTPPTPATVVRVLVEKGQVVEKGQALVVVSAMKMETTLRAPESGRVKAVRCEAGARVNPGDILVEIEPEAKGGEDD